jgi:hypothetical protein
LLLCAVALLPGLASADPYVPTEPLPPVVPTEAASDPTLAHIQHGPVVRGSIDVTSASSRLQVDVFSRRSALGMRGPRSVRIGRYSTVVPAGEQPFAVTLSDLAEGALRSTGRLPVTVKIKVTPPSGALYTATKKATLILVALRPG